LIVVAVLVVVIALAVRRAGRKEERGEKGEVAPPPKREAERLPEAPAPVAEKEVPEEAPEELEERAGLRARLARGLAKTRGGFIARSGKLFGGRKQIDAATMGELEEVLITSDIGVKTSQKIFAAVKKDLSADELADTDTIWTHIAELSEKILD